MSILIKGVEMPPHGYSAAIVIEDCGNVYSEYTEQLVGNAIEVPEDVQPVVHGEWKQTGGKYSRHKTIDRRILTCSVCGNFLYMEGVNAGRGDANYCPNCGADMRGEP